MKNNEVIETLIWLLTGMENGSMESIDCSDNDIILAMNRAIKCVELMPELVEALDWSNKQLRDWEIAKLISKAKELIE